MTENAARTHGILYIVATPIGNRDDISIRALKTLQSVDFILAEDTRHSRPLLTTLGIKRPMFSFHDHNEIEKSQSILDKLKEGQSGALISDAGTPLINDPGFTLVSLAREQQITIVPIPGASALITALSAAGVACDTFTFCGFLPAKQTARCQKLASLQSITHTLIFYESTHRIVDALNDIKETLGSDCNIVLAKELTKAFERFITGRVDDVTQWLLSNTQHTKGEFVIIIAPRPQEKKISGEERILSLLLK